ncbi:DMT family transporter [Longibacter salinarum]|uniref:DMT family transporter n=1 Tax=Longibacter salinarum TaxID=1850348 RepID=UPI0015CF7A47|nr:DMT family transporter [Longibacter salinarum]
MPTDSWKSDASLLLVVLIWGANFPILKVALEAMPIHVLNVFRFIVSAGVLGSMYLWSRRGQDMATFFAPFKRHARRLIVLALIGYVFYQVCFVVGVNNTTAGSAALIMTSAPMWTAVVGQIAGTEYLGRFAWIGLAVSMLGTAFVVAAGSETVAVGAGSLFGNAVILLGAILWGAYTALNKPVVSDISPVAATFFGIMIALPVLAGIGAPYASGVAWGEVDLWVWLAIIFSGGLSTGIAFVIWNTAVRNVGASNTAIYNNLVPLVALAGGVLFLDETVNAWQIAGGVLIIAGLVLVRRYRLREAA